jgi:peptidoglycan-N-acetylglucosamine deacetylase
MKPPDKWLPPFMELTLRSTNKRTIQAVEWPDGARCCVSIHIHVDGQTVWRALGMEKLVYISNGEYGPRTAVWRLLDLLERRGLKASFFIPGWTAETYPDVVRAAGGAGHEIGHHSYSHTLADMGLTDAGTWDRATEEREFDRALEVLQRLSGQEIRGYVPPGGELSPHTIDILQSRGIRYQAQCAADDIPYWWEIDGKACGLLEVPTHWSIDDAPQFLYTLIPQMGFIKGPDEVYGMWKGDFDAYRHYGRCLVFQVHPQWIGRPGRMRMFERLIDYIQGFDDVWFATGREIDEYWRERYPPDVVEALTDSTAPL